MFNELKKIIKEQIKLGFEEKERIKKKLFALVHKLQTANNPDLIRTTKNFSSFYKTYIEDVFEKIKKINPRIYSQHEQRLSQIQETINLLNKNPYDIELKNKLGNMIYMLHGSLVRSVVAATKT